MSNLTFVLEVTYIFAPFVLFLILIKSLLNMNRLFGKAKAKNPPPNLSECIAGVSIYHFMSKTDFKI